MQVIDIAAAEVGVESTSIMDWDEEDPAVALVDDRGVCVGDHGLRSMMSESSTWPLG